MSRFVFAALVSLIAVSCTTPQASPESEGSPASEKELIVFAASSLTDAFTEIGTEFEAANPGITVTFNFASSSDLATQIIEGAPADVFASANEKQMQNVDTAEGLGSTPIAFLTNRLVVIFPADNPGQIRALNDLGNDNRRLVLAGPDVPIRLYSDEVIAKLDANEGFEPGFAERVYANLVSEEDNVRQVAAKVALGEADAGIVYNSDITPDIADEVGRLDIPDEFNVVAVYPIAVGPFATHPEESEIFIDFVLSETGQSILQKWGFGKAPGG